jgi:hypothetical protein
VARTREHRDGAGRLLKQFTQAFDFGLPLAARQHLGSRVVTLIEDADDRTGLVAYRCEAIVPIRFFDTRTALHRQHPIEGGKTLPGRNDLRELRFDDVPDVRPHFPGRLTERPRMFVRRNRRPGVVI